MGIFDKVRKTFSLWTGDYPREQPLSYDQQAFGGNMWQMNQATSFTRTTSARNKADQSAILRHIIRYHQNNIIGSMPVSVSMKDYLQEFFTDEKEQDEFTKKLKQEWLWWQKKNLTIDNKNLNEVARSVFYGLYVDGDCFIIKNYMGSGKAVVVGGGAIWRYSTGIQLEANEVFLEGIIYNSKTWERVAYCFNNIQDTPLGIAVRSNKMVRVPASQVVHINENPKPINYGIRSGSHLSPMTSVIDIMDRGVVASLYKMLKNAKVFLLQEAIGALGINRNSTANDPLKVGGSSTNNNPAPELQNISLGDDIDRGMNGGTWLRPRSASKLEGLGNTTDSLKDLVNTNLMNISAGANIPQHVLVGDYSRTNYSASQHASKDYKIFIQQWQNTLGDKLYRAWAWQEFITEFVFENAELINKVFMKNFQGAAIFEAGNKAKIEKARDKMIKILRERASFSIHTQPLVEAYQQLPALMQAFSGGFLTWAEARNILNLPTDSEASFTQLAKELKRAKEIIPDISLGQPIAPLQQSESVSINEQEQQKENKKADEGVKDDDK